VGSQCTDDRVSRIASCFEETENEKLKWLDAFGSGVTVVDLREDESNLTAISVRAYTSTITLG
jgi:hypothetical protein